MSKIFGIPDMRGFIGLFDGDPSVSESHVYGDVKRAFGSDFDLEILMTILEDLGREKDALLSRISPQTTSFLLKSSDHINHLIEDKKTKDEAKQLLRKIKTTIQEKCISAESSNENKILDVFDRFFNTLKKSMRLRASMHASGDEVTKYPYHLKIVTTNYDRCIETYLGKRQIEFTQGLAPKFGHSVFDVSSFDDETHAEKIGLFKLHGTIDLFNIDGTIRQRKYGEQSGEEVVYYPLEFSGYQHIIESPYLELFYLFRDRMNKDNEWIIVGSSLRDRTICSIMNDVIRLKREGDRPNVLLVNPDKTIPDRLEKWGFFHLKKRMSQVQDEFGEDSTNEKILQFIDPSWSKL